MHTISLIAGGRRHDEMRRRSQIQHQGLIETMERKLHVQRDEPARESFAGVRICDCCCRRDILSTREELKRGVRLKEKLRFGEQGLRALADRSVRASEFGRAQRGARQDEGAPPRG